MDSAAAQARATMCDRGGLRRVRARWRRTHHSSLSPSLPPPRPRKLTEALHRKLGHGVRDLLEQDRAQASVKAERALVLEDVRKAGRQRLRESLVRDGADAHGLQRAQEQVRDELGECGRCEVDVRAIFPRLLLRQGLGHQDLEKLDTAELEPALHEVAAKGRAQARQQCAGALGGDHAPECVNHALAVLGGVQLDARLHHVHGLHRGSGQ